MRRKDGVQQYSLIVSDPERFGVVEFDESKTAISIEEKPTAPNPSSPYWFVFL